MSGPPASSHSVSELPSKPSAPLTSCYLMLRVSQGQHRTIDLEDSGICPLPRGGDSQTWGRGGVLTLGSAWEGLQEKEGLSGAARLMGKERQILPQHDQYPKATGW